MLWLLFVAVFLLCLVLIHLSNLVYYADLNKLVNPTLYLYNNDNAPLLSPPQEFVITENELSCHRTPTPCTSNADCQLCIESLASCQLFSVDVILELSPTHQMQINAGESYCLALDNRSARSCNPNTGTWMLRQVDSENFALICHCDTPGLVTQLNIYDDCTLAVGCAPNGIIADINSSPLRCLCDEGYVSELSATNTPYCRPKVLRDVMLDPSFFHRPPCSDGFLPADHPAFDTIYRRQIGANVCLPDPCSIDPVTGEVHLGRTVYNPTGGIDNGPLVMCQCSIEHDLYPVYSQGSMLSSRYAANDFEITNYCLKPLTVTRRDVRSDIKVFWGRNSLKSDADIVFQVNRQHVHEPYHVLLYQRLSQHPTVNTSTTFVLKFQLNSAHVSTSTDNVDVFQGYCHLNYLRTNINSCPLPGQGLCTNPQVCGNISCTYNPCIGSVASLGYRDRCYFFRVNPTFDNMGTVGRIVVWNTPTYYAQGNAPVTFFVNALGATDGGYGFANDVRTFYFSSVDENVPSSQYTNLNQILATYPLYNS
ncbi:per os infectivity factor 1 [Erinnyis ello granulovirus]|uniref:Per os infectivity factor 1 n=1 Tax=Erinnyis ello granulovirus TaxID=307444 RepID=A0A097DAL9_9BBAC|nr:per os infectivity factor 1 [Erinnyis ello granulovirus]AIS92066.1 per os infectivity factor 1 [Erinnyis ello granulovirus]ARX71406.1 per os infectivity factor 1 [Erinnyis ello granulovirus]ARX71536.1 per os infectivity factor 1 [Erinnyis ello granulovirus]ARX71666.1 per os infectivity factor 1 [Erinnyis ello granulovirus]ARX71796.1 per os infectivity factor 1 [Erinnyis ello granulovirus]